MAHAFIHSSSSQGQVEPSFVLLPRRIRPGAGAGRCTRGPELSIAAQDYIEKAWRFAARLGLGGDLSGNAAWSAADVCEAEVPIGCIFCRLQSALNPPSVQEVEEALDALEISTASAEQEALLTSPTATDGGLADQAAAAAVPVSTWARMMMGHDPRMVRRRGKLCLRA